MSTVSEIVIIHSSLFMILKPKVVQINVKAYHCALILLSSSKHLRAIHTVSTLQTPNIYNAMKEHSCPDGPCHQQILHMDLDICDYAFV